MGSGTDGIQVLLDGGLYICIKSNPGLLVKRMEVLLNEAHVTDLRSPRKAEDRIQVCWEC
jgi:hypothetical protein